MSVECTECSEFFDSKGAMRQHRSMIHGVYSSKIERECDHCGSTFEVYESEKENGSCRFCSRECHADSMRAEKEYTCKNCEDEFYRASSTVEETGAGKFCSRQCESDHKTVECTCLSCGKKYRIPRSHYKLDGAGKFCSKECESDYRTIITECDVCSDEIKVVRSRYENQDSIYCSTDCMAKDYRQSNPDIRRSAEYRNWRSVVLDRDEYTCQDCGREDNLHAHHIVPVYDDDSLSTEVDNGVTVCQECHAKRHEERGDNHIAALIRGM